MSTISEVDIRDWDSIQPKAASQAFERIWEEFMEDGDLETLRNFFTQVELLRDKQIKAAQKNVAALFKPIENMVKQIKQENE